MSDNLEKYMRENSEAFDTRNPSQGLWSRIDRRLAENAKPRPTGKILLGGFILATVVAMSAFILFGGENNPEDKNNSQVASANTRVELEGYSEFVKPVLEGVNVPYQHYPVSASEPSTVKIENGTQLVIPENAFVDASGNLVKGEVELSYREFHNTADVMASGIPMKFEENGTVYDFQTAGMVDLRGSQNGQPVFIAPGKEIEISMASFAAGEDFNLYFLNPETQKWEEIGQPESSQNEEKQKALAALPPLEEENGGTPTVAEQSANPNTTLPVDKVNASGKNGKEFKNEFDFTVDYSQFPELRAFKDVKWKAVDESKIKANQWIFTEVWRVMTLKTADSTKHQYSIELSNSQKTFSIVVTPVIKDGTEKERMEQYASMNAKFTKARKDREEEVKRINSQADMLRTFKVSNFGVYNCDRYYKFSNPVRIAANFVIDQELSEKYITVFHSTGNKTALLTYAGLSNPSFTFSPEEDNCLIVVLPGNQLAVFNQADFDKLNAENLRRNGSHDFKMRIIPGKVENTDQLMSVINGTTKLQSSI